MTWAGGAGHCPTGVCRLLRAPPRPTGVDPGHWRAGGGLRAQMPFAWGPKQPRRRRRVATTVRLPGGGGRAGPLEITDSFRFVWFCNVGTFQFRLPRVSEAWGRSRGGRKGFCWGPEGPWCSFGITAWAFAASHHRFADPSLGTRGPRCSRGPLEVLVVSDALGVQARTSSRGQHRQHHRRSTPVVATVGAVPSVTKRF